MAACTRLVRSTLSVTASDIKTPIHGLKHTRIATSVGRRLNAYNPAHQRHSGSMPGRAKHMRTEKADEKRIVLGWHATRNKEEERESVMTFLAVFGFFMTGLFFIVPEMLIFFPALFKAVFGVE